MNQPQPPKDDKLPVGELKDYINDMFRMVWRDADMSPITHTDKHVVCNSATDMTMKRVEALFTAATNEKLAGGGDEPKGFVGNLYGVTVLPETVEEVLEMYAKDKNIVDAVDCMQRLIDTAKQTAVAEERARLIGLLPKIADDNDPDTIYLPGVKDQIKGARAAVDEMRNVLEGK